MIRRILIKVLQYVRVPLDPRGHIVVFDRTGRPIHQFLDENGTSVSAITSVTLIDDEIALIGGLERDFISLFSVSRAKLSSSLSS